MALINVTNSTYLVGIVSKITLSDGASTLATVSPGVTSERAADLALTYSHSHAHQSDVQGVRHYLSIMLQGEVSLFRLQAMLNDPVWDECGIRATAYFEVAGVMIQLQSL